ncbi:MAG TPA: carboxypeptidase-like regulatory domain-containing protein [Terracidiphilus sp.]
MRINARQIHWAILIGLVLLFASPQRSFAQVHQPSVDNLNALPDAPQPQQAVAQQPVPNPQPAATATLSGTVLDTNGTVIQGARVVLNPKSGGQARTIQTGGDGQFVFRTLPAGSYTLTVTGQGLSTYSSPQIDLEPGAVLILPTITLSIQATSTSVTVTADNDQLAEEQVQIAVQQRVLSVIPNFYTTYDWNAPPMQAKQKFKLSVHAMFDPTAFVIIAGVAGAEQYKDVYPGFGRGWEGYGKRYGATFANHVSDQFFAHALYASIFHQDPRYFYKGKGSVSSRALYAMSAAVIARGDDGRWKPNYSSVLGKLTSGALSNLYFPESDRGANLVFFNAMTEIGSDAVENLLEEFLLKNLTSHAPKGAQGGP